MRYFYYEILCWYVLLQYCYDILLRNFFSKLRENIKRIRNFFISTNNLSSAYVAYLYLFNKLYVVALDTIQYLYLYFGISIKKGLEMSKTFTKLIKPHHARRDHTQKSKFIMKNWKQYITRKVNKLLKLYSLQKYCKQTHSLICIFTPKRHSLSIIN